MVLGFVDEVAVVLGERVWLEVYLTERQENGIEFIVGGRGEGRYSLARRRGRHEGSSAERKTELFSTAVADGVDKTWSVRHGGKARSRRERSGRIVAIVSECVLGCLRRGIFGIGEIKLPSRERIAWHDVR